MDLMEYQAKELFAKHDVPVTLGKTVESAADAKAAAEEIGRRWSSRRRSRPAAAARPAA